MDERAELSVSVWSDEDGRKTEATFVGWVTPFQSSSPHHDAGDIVAHLVAALLGRLKGASIENTVRSIERCPVCGAVAFVSGSGIFASGVSDDEVAHARNQVVADSAGWCVLGSAELWLTRDAGGHFVSPTLIAHYVQAHGYNPPAAFVARLLASNG